MNPFDPNDPITEDELSAYGCGLSGQRLLEIFPGIVGKTLSELDINDPHGILGWLTDIYTVEHMSSKCRIATTRNDIGQPIEMVLSNGVTRTFNYDDGLLVSIQEDGVTTSTYAYDSNRNRVAAVEETKLCRSYTYSEEGKLIRDNEVRITYPEPTLTVRHRNGHEYAKRVDVNGNPIASYRNGRLVLSLQYRPDQTLCRYELAEGLCMDGNEAIGGTLGVVRRGKKVATITLKPKPTVL